MPKHFFIISILILALVAPVLAWDSEPVAPESIQHYKNGVDQFELGNFSGAELELLKAIEISPHYPEACVALANVYSVKRCYAKAIIFYQKAIALRPNTSEAYMGLGMAAVCEGDYDLAALAYQHAIEINYNNAKAFMCLGKIYKYMGQNDNAKASLSRAKDIFEQQGDTKSAERIDRALKDKRMDE
jgi:Tfp pilus assembly protein PilF